jgi:hypothetical protein
MKHSRTCCCAVGHVSVRPQYAEHSLLPVPAAELVTNHRVAVVAHLDVGVLTQTELVPHQCHLERVREGKVGRGLAQGRQSVTAVC